MRKLTLCFLFAGLLVAVLAMPAAVADHSKGNVDELRLGDRLGADGEVAPHTGKDHFVPDTPIHITMRVKEARKDTPLLVNIVDRQTEVLVWSNEKKVPGGHAVMHFLVERGELASGKYRVRVKLGDDWVAEHEFLIE